MSFLWASLCMFVLGVVTIWNALPSSLKAAVILFMISAILMALTIYLLHMDEQGIGQILPKPAREFLIDTTLIDLLQNNWLSPFVPDLLALFCINLSMEEQQDILSRLPHSIRKFFLAKGALSTCSLLSQDAWTNFTRDEITTETKTPNSNERSAEHVEKAIIPLQKNIFFKLLLHRSLVSLQQVDFLASMHSRWCLILFFITPAVLSRSRFYKIRNLMSILKEGSANIGILNFLLKAIWIGSAFSLLLRITRKSLN